jgi:DNA polymerase
MSYSADLLTWFDFEVYSQVDLQAGGAFRYATDPATKALVLAYAIGGGPARAWHADGAVLDWHNAPDDLRAAFLNDTMFAAWNASFDVPVWNYATLNFPFLDVERVIDPMVQTGVSNLPLDLEHASRYVGGTGKQEDGKELIKLFCIEGAPPAEYPDKWQRFLNYACQDVEEMRFVYRRTRPLPRAEWEQYWAFERINQRGLHIDVPFVERAAALAAEDATVVNRRLNQLTGGAINSVNRAQRIAEWMHNELADAVMREVLVCGAPDDDADDEDPAPELSLTRDRVGRVLAMLDAKRAVSALSDREAIVREVAELRLYGAGASPKKFSRLLAQHVDGVLRGQYRFAGAGQTGRVTSKGAQIQNITRDVLGKDGAAEAALVGLIADGCTHAQLAVANPVDVPVARKLALLVRPALVAGPGKTFVWSDWSAIEARVTPWLPASPGGEQVLDVFRGNDCDPSRPDIYTVAAAGILRTDPRAIIKAERNIGKVATLALGFGGSVGALMNMALAYRIHLEPGEARRIVDAWREANPWAREFWAGIWDAAMNAWDMPGHITTAGRLAFTYREDYLGGTLFMALPSGRLLTYPQPRWRDVDVKDKDGKPTGEKRTELSFRRAYGRAKLWHGTLCENAVQATAADILRQTVTRIETNPALSWMPIRMTTHDEIVCECEEARADEAKAILRREMLTVPSWAKGLPLQSEETVCGWYTKAKVTP